MFPSWEGGLGATQVYGHNQGWVTDTALGPVGGAGPKVEWSAYTDPRYRVPRREQGSATTLPCEPAGLPLADSWRDAAS